MTSLLEYIVDKKHHQFRTYMDWNPAVEYSQKQLSPVERMTERFERMCAAQTPVFLPDEKICFLRTAVAKSNDVFTQEEWAEIKSKHFIHELGYMSNISPDYESTIREGLLKKRESADVYSQRTIDALIDLSDRYRAEAIRLGKKDIAEVLEQVPRYGARNFREALQFFRIIHFGMWLENDYHNTIGRFDQYMYPYFIKDMESGVYTRETALELLEDFFLSFNKDSDLYVGVQQGDNGQSMVLGGMTRDGSDGFNLLSELCLEASEHLLLIDPKINLRVNKNTPLRVYELGSRLTRAGLGFPQYSNDDVVIEGLVKLGYDRQDAIDYVVAACWEFIIPKVGADIANIGALSFPLCVDRAIHKTLPTAQNFAEVMEAVKAEIHERVEEIVSGIDNVWFVPSPFMKINNDCEDICKGAKYNNFGIHGTGIATAADSLTAIQQYVYGDGSISAEQMLEAVDSDFEKHSELLPKLRYETPKMGQDNDLPDGIASQLLAWFAEEVKGRTNCKGGIFRAGTGSAMYYLWHANEIGASPDGRRKGEAFGTNYSPSLFMKSDGPISVIKSFTKPAVQEAINGGPLTLEFANSMFADADCIQKVAMLVKYFIDRGGHQLQLNAVNLDKLKDAQLHPERHRQLVVRIWGWSAYFVELDKEYQDHVMARQEYRV